MSNKIALAMISRGTGDDPRNLRRALESIAPYVDGIFITLTGAKSELHEAEKVCKDFRAHISYTHALWTVTKEVVEWLTSYLGYAPHMKVGDQIFVFDEARNFNFAQVPREYGWLLWVDTDDVFQGGEHLRKLTVVGERENIEAFYMRYLYEVQFADDDICRECDRKVEPNRRKIKNIVIEHLRERLVRNNGHFKWIAPIHETFIEQVPTRKTDTDDCVVIHLATTGDRFSSLTRNLKNLELAVYKSEGKDPRHVYYLAKAYFDLRTPDYNDKAIPLIFQYLNGEHRSGWPQERSQACEYLAEIYRRKNEFNNAIKAGMNALIEYPENPTIFLSIALSYMYKKDWERALFWTKLASTIPENRTTLVKNPLDAQGTTLEIIYNASLNLGRIDEAWAAAHKIHELVPHDSNAQNMYNYISDLRKQRDITKIIARLSDYLKATNERHKIKPLLMAVPKISEDAPYIIDLNQKNNPPTYWDEKSVVIYCGPGFTHWSPKRLTNPQESFVGGSEEAVIYMSREIQKLGWEVTVYADPGLDEGEYDGVTWLPYYKFNKLDHFNILVVWRQVGFLDQNLNVKKIYVWNHDIQLPHDWTEPRVNKLTKAFFLSKWHRDNVPHLPEEKVMITSNGL